MTDGTERAQYSEGGDPVCWSDRVCEECGAFRETADPTCARCGRPYPGAGPSSPAGPRPLPSEHVPSDRENAPRPPSALRPPGRRADQ